MVGVQGLELSAWERELLLHPVVGGVTLFTRNFESVEQLCRLTADIHSLRSPPLLIGVDHEGGRVQRFRSPFTHLPGVGVLGEVIKFFEYAGMGCIFLGLIIIDGRALKLLQRISGPTGNEKGEAVTS